MNILYLSESFDRHTTQFLANLQDLDILDWGKICDLVNMIHKEPIHKRAYPLLLRIHIYNYYTA